MTSQATVGVMPSKPPTSRKVRVKFTSRLPRDNSAFTYLFYGPARDPNASADPK